MAEAIRTSTQEFNPSLEHSRVNPTVPTSNISSDYNRKIAEANEIINIAQNFGKSFGLATYRKEQREQLERVADEKINREELIQAEIEGNSLAGGGGEYSAPIARDILNKSNKFRKSNPKLVAMLNRGFLLKTGEMTISEFNSKVKTNAEPAIEQIGLEWIQKQKKFGIKAPDFASRQTFSEFVAEWIDNDSSESIQKMVDENELIDEVLGQKGKRLNYDPVLASAGKWFRDYKLREKSKEINKHLSKQFWPQVTGKQFHKPGGIRDGLMSEFGLSKQRANLETIGHLRGHFLNRLTKEGDGLLGDIIFTRIQDILTHPDAHGVSLLKGEGDYSVGEEAEKLLNLVNSTRKKLFDKSETLRKDKKNKSDSELEDRKKLGFSEYVSKTYKKIALAKNEKDIRVLRDSVLEMVKVPYDQNIGAFNSVGNVSYSDLMLAINVKDKAIKSELGKPTPIKVLTEDERNKVKDAIFELGKIKSNSNILGNLQKETDAPQIENLLSRIEKIYHGLIGGALTNQREAFGLETTGLGTDFQEWDGLYEEYKQAKSSVTQEKYSLQKRIDDREDKKDLQTKKHRVEKRKVDNDVKNSVRATFLVDKMMDGLDTYSALPIEERKESDLTALENLLTEKAKRIELSNDGLFLKEVEVDLFGAAKTKEHRQTIASAREKTARAKEAAAKEVPITTDETLREGFSTRISNLRKVPVLQLHNNRDKPAGKIAKLKSDLSKEFLAKKMTTSDFDHFTSLINSVSKNVENTLDERYGSKTIYDQAEQGLSISILGGAEDGLRITFLAESGKNLLKATRIDLQRFYQSMIKRYPDTFVEANFDNHNIRLTILNAYVEWMEGKKDTTTLIKGYTDVKGDVGEFKRRFTGDEEQMLIDSIPRTTSLHKKAFEDLALSLKEKTAESTTTIESNIPTDAEIEQQIEEAAAGGNIVTREQIIQAAAKGKKIIWEEKGDYVKVPVLVDITDENLTDENLEELLFK